MKTIIALGAVIAIVSLTGCATTTSQNNGSAAYTTPNNFNYGANQNAALTTSNPGSLFDPNEKWENNSL